MLAVFDLRIASHWMILGILLLCAALDSFLAWLGGDRSTWSRVFLDAESHRPSLCFLMSYSAAVLVWHLCIVSFQPAPVWYVALAKAIVVCAPILTVFVIIAVTPPETDNMIQRLGKMKYGMHALLYSCTASGWLMAWWGVSQHAGV